MDTLTLKGKYQIDNKTEVKEPTVSILSANYNYESMTVQLTLKFENVDYAVIRQSEEHPITDTNGLSKSEIKTIVQSMLSKVKK